MLLLSLLSVHEEGTSMNKHSTWFRSVAGEPFTFTPWGLLSGLFWVPGGTAGIAAVRTAGLAVSQGTWSTLKIMVRIPLR